MGNAGNSIATFVFELNLPCCITRLFFDDCLWLLGTKATFRWWRKCLNVWRSTLRIRWAAQLAVNGLIYNCNPYKWPKINGFHCYFFAPYMEYGPLLVTGFWTHSVGVNGKGSSSQPPLELLIPPTWGLFFVDHGYSTSTSSGRILPPSFWRWWMSCFFVRTCVHRYCFASWWLVS